MRFGKLFFVSALGVYLGLSSIDTRDALACGGCFPPPGEQSSVVTDHRMVMSISKTQSTLYDQIQFTGNPSEFAWVLPIAGTVDVGLSADSFFAALDGLSSVTVRQPPTNCPAPQDCNSSSSGASGGFASGAAAPESDDGVDVLKKEVVGPYETVQLKSDDPQALTTWLTTNGFNIPDDIKPVIAQYVAEKLNFLALRLKPGAGVGSMRPVRVTTQGAGAVLPLRMVAAGTGANVGITLWVISEGRYEPQNFPSFVIRDDDLVWDWATSSSNYKDLRAARTAASGGKAWEIESSLPTSRSTVRSRTLGNGFGPNGSATDYLPIEDDNGGITKTAEAVRTEDLATAFAGITPGQEHLTRIRADLSRQALATDLQLVASSDQSSIPTFRLPSGEKGQPLCPIFENCRQVGTAPRDQAIARANTVYTNGSGSTCQSGPASNGGGGAVAAFGTLVALSVTRAMRRRRR